MRPILAVALVAALAASQSHAAVVTEPALAAATRNGSFSSSGLSYTLEQGAVSAGTDMTAFTITQAELKFALAPVIPAGDVISSALLSLNFVSGNPINQSTATSATVALRAFATDASGITLANFGAPNANNLVEFVVNFAAPGVVRVDVTGVARAIFAANPTAAAIGFQVDNATGDTFVNFSRADDAVAGNRPALTLTTVPEPASLAMAAIGVCLAAAGGRHGFRFAPRRLA